MSKTFILSESLRNDLINCIANAIHNKYEYIQINTLVNHLQNLPEEKVNPPEVSSQ